MEISRRSLPFCVLILLGAAIGGSAFAQQAPPPTESLTELEEAVRRDPNNAESRRRFGAALHRGGQLQRAIEEYRDAIRLSPGDVRLYLGLAGVFEAANLTREAEAYLRLEQFEKSIAAAETAIGIDPEHLGSHYLRATALIRSGRAEAARLALDVYRNLETESRIREQREREIGCIYKAALAEALDGNGAEAVRLLRIGIEKFPDSRILRIYLADLMAGTGRTRDALVRLAEAIALPRPEGLDEPTDRRQQGIIHQRIGDIQSALNNFDEAVAAYLRSLEIDRGLPEGRAKQGKAYFSIDRIEEALEEYERAAAKNPDDPETHLNLAESHLAGGDWPSAVDAATRAIELGTTDSQALYLLGTALVRQARRDEDMEHLREFQSVEAEFLELEHRNREIDAIGLDAIEAFREGNPEAAVESLREGIGLYPEADRLYMNLAMVQNRMGEHRAAVDTYERMLEVGIGRTFLVHRNLAGEYDAPGNIEASQRHRQIYLETRDAELIVYAPE